MAFIKNVESFYNKLSQLVPSPDHHFCDISFSSLPSIFNIRDHKRQCDLKQMLLFPEEQEKVKFMNYAYTYYPSHLCFFGFETLNTLCQKDMVVAEQRALGYAFVTIDRQ